MIGARIGAVVAVLAFGLVPATAQAQGADAQGWWSEFHQSGQPTPPAPPDVAADDLLLQGGDAARQLPATGVVDQTPSPSAVGALRFTVAPGSEVGALVVTVAAGAQAADVRAYPAQGAWVPVQAGAIQDAPKPDLSRYSAGRLSADGATLDFPDIGRLVTDQGLLSVVLVPGPADRVVVHKPPATALSVTAPVDPGAPELAAPSTPQPQVPDPARALVLAPVGIAVAPQLQALPAPAAPTVIGPGVAPVPAAPVANQAAATRRLVADDARSRIVVLLELLLVTAFFGLLGQGPLALLSRLTGQPAEVDEARGVGRFRTGRTGRAPRL